MTELLESIAVWWCRRMHRDITRPVSGHYICLHCQRQYAVPWHEQEAR